MKIGSITVIVMLLIFIQIYTGGNDMSTYKGIDVSYWQGNIDWKKVKEDGIEFAVLREGYRQTIDKTFLQNVKGAKSAGLVVMVYHFIYTDGATPEQNAQSTVRNMKQAGLDVSQTMIFADLEYDTWKKNGETCTREKCTEYTERYLNECKKLGCKRLGIYLNIDYYRNYYSDDIKKAYPIWLADYTGVADYDCIMQQNSSSGRVSGINGNVDMNTLYDGSYMSGNTQEGGNTMGVTAQDVLNVMRSWLGYSEANRKYIEILNTYNSHKPLARGYAIKPHDEWCDATVSAAAIKAGAVDLIGTEVGVERHVDIFKVKGIWIEDGSITPQTGDVIVFNWDGTSQPNNGYSDHIGYVESVSGGVITTIEGNSSEAVRRKTYRVGQACIRGFARPRYAQSSQKPVQPSKPAQKDLTTIAKEVISGAWGNGDDRKARLESAGYSYSAVQQEVNRLLGGTSKPQLKPLSEIAREVLRGDWGNGSDRKRRLEQAGYNYQAVQVEVNRLAGASSVDIDKIAHDVIRGAYGNGTARRNALVAKYGASVADAVQRRVNQLL